MVQTSEGFDELDVETRQCKLPHETSGFQFLTEYTRIGCEIECAAKKATSFCKCVPWNYPNNFTSLPICDMFGGYCFDTIMSNETFYKQCPLRCLEDCQVWQYRLGTIHKGRLLSFQLFDPTYLPLSPIFTK